MDFIILVLLLLKSHTNKQSKKTKGDNGYILLPMFSQMLVRQLALWNFHNNFYRVLHVHTSFAEDNGPIFKVTRELFKKNWKLTFSVLKVYLLFLSCLALILCGISVPELAPKQVRVNGVKLVQVTLWTLPHYLVCQMKDLETFLLCYLKLCHMKYQ